jgi:hypothetical protein
MDATDEGRAIALSDEQLENAEWPIRDSFESGPNVTLTSLLHFQQQFAPITSTDEGIASDLSSGHSQNVDSSMQTRGESAGNTTLSNFRHALKHSVPIVSTEDGIKIELSGGRCLREDPVTVDRQSNSDSEARGDIV